MKLISCEGQTEWERKRNRETIVICCICARRLKLSKAYADLDGKPFKAYYCARCAEIRKQFQALLVKMQQEIGGKP